MMHDLNFRGFGCLVEYRVTFTSLEAVCSVLVDLLAVAANWIEDPCKRNHLRLLQG